MKLRTNYIVITLFSIWGISNTVLAQNAKEVLKKLNTTYTGKSYQMNYSVKTTNGSSNTIVTNYKGVVAKEGVNLYLNTSEELTIVNQRYHVYVNKLEQIIFVNEVPKKNQKQPLDALSDLDSLMTNKSIKLLASTNKIYQIEIKLNQEQPYSKIIFTINKKYQLVGCTYLLTDQNYPFDKIEITYSNILVGKKINQKLFSTKSVLKKIKNKVVPVAKYKGYQLIDNRTIKKD